MAEVAHSPFGEMLLARQAVTAADLDRATRIQQTAGGDLGALLVGIGALSEDALLRHRSDYLDVPYLRDPEQFPDHHAVYRFMSRASIKLDWLLDNRVVLWRESAGEEDETLGDAGAQGARGQLCCIARDVRNRALLETLNYFHPDERPAFYLAANHQIDRLLDQVRKEREIESLFSGDEAKHWRELAEEAPIVALVSNLLSQAVDIGTSS